jgi:hypothetical protein
MFNIIARKILFPLVLLVACSGTLSAQAEYENRYLVAIRHIRSWCSTDPTDVSCAGAYLHVQFDHETDIIRFPPGFSSDMQLVYFDRPVAFIMEQLGSTVRFPYTNGMSGFDGWVEGGNYNFAECAITVDDPAEITLIASSYGKTILCPNDNFFIKISPYYAADTTQHAVEIQVFDEYTHQWVTIGHYRTPLIPASITFTYRNIAPYVKMGQPIQFRTKKLQFDGNYVTYQSPFKIIYYPIFSFPSGGNIIVDIPVCKDVLPAIKIPYSGEENDINQYIFEIEAPGGNGRNYQINGDNKEKITIKDDGYFVISDDFFANAGTYNLKIEHSALFYEENTPCAFDTTFVVPDIPNFYISTVQFPNKQGGYEVPKIGSTDSVQLFVSGSKTQQIQVYAGDEKEIIGNTLTLQNNGYFSGDITFKLSAGNYDICVRNDYCTSNTLRGVILKQPDSIRFSVQQTKLVSCHTSSLSGTKNDGTIMIDNVSGGVGNYDNYTIKLNGVTQTLDSNNELRDLAAAEYLLEISDGYNESDTTIIIASHGLLAIDVEKILPPSLWCLTDGALVVNASGGYGPYMYSITPSSAGFDYLADIRGYPSGDSAVYVRDGLQCIAGFPVKIPSAPAEMTVIPISTAPICSTDNNGTCTVTVHNTKGKLTYEASLSFGNDNPVTDMNQSAKTIYITGKSGNYSLTLTDSLGGASCSLEKTLTIPAKAPVSFTGTRTPAGDKGSATGKIEIKNLSSGNTGDFAVSLWNGGNRIADATGVSSSYLFDGLAHGSYTVRVVDSKGCLQEDTYTIEEPDDTLKLSCQIDRTVSCHGMSDGEVTLTAEDGWGNYRFKKNDGEWQASSVFSGLPAGTYTFYVKDASNIPGTLSASGSALQTVVITQPDILTAGASGIRDALCKGDRNGEILYRVSGGTKPYHFDFRSGQEGTENVISADELSVTDLSAGYHAFKIIDANGCETTTQQELVSEPPALRFPYTEITDTQCEEPDNGVISALAVGGTEPYAYTLTVNGSEDSRPVQSGMFATDTCRFTDLQPLSYRLTVEDAHQCTFSVASLDIADYINPAIASYTKTDVRCFDEHNGMIALTPNIPVTHNLLRAADIDHYTIRSTDDSYRDTVSAAGLFTGLPPDSLYVRAFDVNGCASNDSLCITIDEPEQLYVAVDSIRPVLGKGEASGYINFRILGGNDSLKNIRIYDHDQAIGEMADGSGKILRFDRLFAGDYTIKVSDRKGCSDNSAILQVAEPAQALGFVVTENRDASCKSQTGSITVEGFGGWGSYLYKRKISGGFSSDNVFGNLYAGRYTITVTDRMGATFSEDITVYEPKDSLTAISAEWTSPTCGDNGSLSVAVYGGTMPYRLFYDECADTLYIAEPQTVQLTGMSGDACLIHLMDHNGCRFDLETAPEDTARLKIVSISLRHPGSAGASDGSARATVVGGQPPYAYRWNRLSGELLPDEGDVAEQLSSGHYRLKVSETGGCSAEELFYLPDPFDSYFTITATGDETAFEAHDGYAALYAETDGLIAFELRDPQGGIVAFDADGFTAARYMRNDTVYLKQLSGGTWFLSGQHADGQKIIAEFTIQPYERYYIRQMDVRHVAKPGGTSGRIQASVGGGGGQNRFSWKNAAGELLSSADDAGSSILSGVAAGSYTVEVVDRYGNRITATAIVEEPEKELTVSVTATKNESCKDYEDAYVALKAEGGWGDYQFRHDVERYASNNSLYEYLPVRRHYFYLTDKSGVTDSISVDITEPEYLRASVARVDSVLCFGAADGRILFDIAGGTAPYRFEKKTLEGLWTEGMLATGLPEGNHTFMFTDSLSCVGQDTLTVYVPEPDRLLFSDVTVTHTTCSEDNGQMEVTIQGGTAPYSYRWTDAADQTRSDSRIITGLKQNGLYRLRVTDRNHCEQRLEQIIRPSTKPVIDNVAVTPVLCYGDATGTATVTSVTPALPFAPYTLTWSNGDSGNTTRYAAGLWHVTVTDTNRCESVRYFEMTQPDSLRTVLTDSREPHCFGWNDAFLQTRALGGVEPYTYLWSTGDATALIQNLTKGQYFLLLKDANNCRSPQAFIIDEPDEQHVDLGDSITICPGSSFTIDGHNYPAYRWFTAGGNISDERYLTVRNEGDYFLEATDTRGCPVWGEFTVTVGNSALTADFLLSSAAVAGDTLMLIELSNLQTDSLQWIYDSQIFTPINVRDENREYLLQLLCNRTGMYNIGLFAYSDGCSSYAVKQVEVLDAPEKPEAPDALGYRDPLIRSFTVYPNPSGGMFDVEIELREKADIRLTLFEVASGMRLKDRLEYNSDRYLLNFSMPELNTGVYVLILTAGNERKQIKIVIAGN